jgi:hypothetical protein
VSHVWLLFLERRDSDYRIRLSALAHHVFEDPVELAFKTWIKRQADGRYGFSIEPVRQEAQCAARVETVVYR